MAEALVIVPLVMAVYATIDLLVKHTDLLVNGLESHHDFRTMTQNLHAFRVEGAKSQLHQELDLAQQVLRTTNDEDVKINLDNSFQEIQSSIFQAERLLEERGKLHGLTPTARAKKKVKTEEIGVALKSLKAAKDLFASITSKTAMQNALPSLRLLSNDDFKIVRELKPFEYQASLPNETLLVEGNLVGSSSKGLYLLEKRQTQEANVRSLAEILFKLADVRKQLGTSPQGVLNCIGYRHINENGNDNKFHIVFALPGNLKPDNNLQSLIQLRSVSPKNPIPSLNQRIGLCHQLSMAVLEIHKLGLVHKNINTVNVLLMSPKTDTNTVTQAVASVSVGALAQGIQDEQALSIFLADWHLVRRLATSSTFQREEDWWKLLYQHPSRHLESIEKKYSMYHDIYSFGVCMIEILLWRSLVVKVEGQEFGPSPLLERAVGESPSEKSSSSSTRLAYLDGETVQDVLVNIARKELPSAAGTKVTRLVISCLQCLEGGFGPISFSENSMLMSISNFMTTIQKTLWDVKLAL